MKVLHLIHNYHPSVGGSQDLFKNLSERLVATHGDEVTVLTTNALQSPHDRLVEHVAPGPEVVNGVLVRRFRYSRKSVGFFRLAARAFHRGGLPYASYVHLLRSGPVSPGMLKAVIEADADVVAATSSPYLHMYYPHLAALLGRKRPYVYYGALHVDSGIPRAVLHGIRRADAYVAYTAYERDVLVGLGVPAGRIHVVGLGVDAARFSGADGARARARHGLGPGPVVGFLGRQAASKGVDTLVRAMETVWRSVPGAQLLIAGGRTAFSEVLRGMVAALPERLRRQVLFVEGFSHEEKPDLFAACDVFVNASRDESFGIVFLEAWASGTPVIGARTGAVSCVVEEGRDGLLVPYGSADSLAAAIVRVLGDDRLRATLAENGRAKVWNDHTWDGVVERLRAVYEHALDPSRAGGVRPSRGWGQASITSAS